MRFLIKPLIIFLVTLYPLVVFFGLQWLSVRYLAVLIALLLCLRLLTMGEQRSPVWIVVTLFGVILASLGMISANPLFIKLYPVVINVVLLGLFAYSLYRPPSLLTRFATKMYGELPVYAVRHTERFTLVWCVFFALNGMLSLATVLSGSLVLWTWYNGLISYILIGILIGFEWLVRGWVKRKYER